MPRIQYLDKNLGAAKLATIRQANQIIAQYQRQGFTLTLRQLYYQFVARALIPNKMQEYKRLGDVVSDGRLCGLIDWEAIEDRTRSLEKNPSWDDGAEMIEACAKQFHRDMWLEHPVRPEVWIEKEALVGVIEGVCAELDVPYFACRGYASQSELWRAGQRIKRRQYQKGTATLAQGTVVLHLGDHDPSGLDMTRDNAERLSLFAGMEVKVVRLALNMDQVQQYNPPPNPAKTTDARFNGYEAEHGTSSWELDALDPPVIVQLIRDAVATFQKPTPWHRAQKHIERERNRLSKIALDYENIVDQL